MNKKLQFIMLAIVSGGVLAATAVEAKTFEGVIKGAECHLYGKLCGESQSDQKPLFEKDFVLVSGDQYYLLGNLPQDEKLRLNNQSVRVVGDLDRHKISVTSVNASQDGRDQNLWNWEDYRVELYGN